MSKPAVVYRLNYQSFHETDDLQVFDDIEDMDNLIPDDEEQAIILLDGAGDPDRISVIDNDEDPFTVIKATQLTLKFNSSATASMSTFCTGSDQRWRVTRYLGTVSEILWQGYLVLGDNAVSEPYLPTPNVVTLTANCGLALLKEIDLVDADGNNPSGVHKISDYLSWALRLTGLDLSIWAAFNIKNSDLVSNLSIPNTDPEHFFYVNSLDAKTFEAGIGKSVSAYEAIEIILGFEADITQYQGKWFIKRIDEIEDPTRGLYISEFDSSGSFVGNLGEKNYLREIGNDKDIVCSEASTEVTRTRPRKSCKLTFKFENPLEIPCNVDFSRGSNPNVISSTEIRYDIDCWTLRAGFPGGYISAGGTTAYLRKLLVNGYENTRYAVLTPRTVQESGSAEPTYIESEGIPIAEFDKINASVDWRLNLGVASGGGFFRLFRLVIHGDDGSYWILGRPSDTSGSDETQTWYNTSAWTTNTARGKTVVDFDTQDEEDWSTISWEAPPAPVAGTLYIWLNQFNQFAGGDDDKQIWYSNLRVDITAFINGSYQLYSGQSHSTFQDGNYKAKIDEEVRMSDSPRKLFKGSLLRFDGSAYQLVSQFYNAAVFPVGPPSADYIHRYGEIQMFDVWNQYYYEKRVIQLVAQGIDLDKTKDGLPYPAGLINKYSLTDTSLHSNNKFFVLLTFDMGYDKQDWTGTLREVFDTTKEKKYLNHEFKLETNE